MLLVILELSEGSDTSERRDSQILRSMRPSL
jgi:hypothetical protein